MEAVIVKPETVTPEAAKAPDGSTASQSGDLTKVTLKEGTPAEKKEGGDRPAWLPEGFNTPEDLSKAYTELRTKMSKGPDKKEETVTPEATKAARAAVEDAGLLDTLTAEFMQNGKLSDESVTKMTAAGLSQESVNTFISGQKALATALQAEIVKAAGSADKLNVLTSWAQQNLPQAAIDAYNDAIDSGSIEAAKLAVGGLVRQYEKAHGKPPRLVGGESTRTAGLQPFASMNELIVAQSDPRYAEDPAYQKQVMARLRVSKF